MTEPIRDVETAVAGHGALPVPVGDAPQPTRRDQLADLIARQRAVRMAIDAATPTTQPDTTPEEGQP